MSDGSLDVASGRPVMPPPARSSVLEGAIRGVAGFVLARPWFDHAALFALRRYFFPLSRLWAAAGAAHGDVGRFYDNVPMLPRLDEADRVRRVLALFEERRAAVQAIDAEWRRVFFSPEPSSPEYRSGVENARARLRHRLSATRRDFAFLLRSSVPRVRMAIDTPDAADALYGEAVEDLAPFVGAPDVQPSIEVSRPVATAMGRDHWLRFASPSARLGDIVYARVHEPALARDAPTIIFGHGICVEPEHWAGLVDECQTLVRLGYRVIRPDAPWHGRRALPGYFGGEPVIARFPTGALDAFTGALQEWAVLARWARQTSSGPLALAGSSLGAMTSQLAAVAARDWPAAIRPDAMLLLTHTGEMADAVIHGALSRTWADPAEVQARGWTEALARRYFSALDPKAPPVIPPERIVSVLGSRDTVLPYESGRRLVERWGVPADNLFVLDRGHFSVPMTLTRDDAPLRRLAAVLHSIR